MLLELETPFSRTPNSRPSFNYATLHLLLPGFKVLDFSCNNHIIPLPFKITSNNYNAIKPPTKKTSPPHPHHTPTLPPPPTKLASFVTVATAPPVVTTLGLCVSLFPIEEVTTLPLGAGIGAKSELPEDSGTGMTVA
jgi:hypothetical protein